MAVELAERVRLLEADPDLGAELGERARAMALEQLVVAVDGVGRGEWHPESTLEAERGSLGLLVLEGVLTRDVVIAETTCAELVGRGDLLRPWDDFGAGAPVPTEVEWHVLEPASLAVLDRPFALAAGQFPEVVAAIVARSVLRAQALAVALAIHRIIGLKLRVLTLLWHLADRFGWVGSAGVSMPVPLTHALIARLVGATRPSVSTAVKALEREGRISKRPGGGFLLHGDPPELPRRFAERTAPAVGDVRP